MTGQREKSPKLTLFIKGSSQTRIPCFVRQKIGMFQGKTHGKSWMFFSFKARSLQHPDIFWNSPQRSQIWYIHDICRPWSIHSRPKKSGKLLGFYNSDPTLASSHWVAPFLDLQWQLASKKWMPGCVSIGHPPILCNELALFSNTFWN